MNEIPNSTDLSALVISELKDIYGIKYRKDKKHKNHHSNGHHRIFGVSLKELEFTEVKLSGGNYCRVPAFVHDACCLIKKHVATEGLFRKAGSSIRQREIRVRNYFLAQFHLRIEHFRFAGETGEWNPIG